MPNEDNTREAGRERGLSVAPPPYQAPTDGVQGARRARRQAFPFPWVFALHIALSPAISMAGADTKTATSPQRATADAKTTAAPPQHATTDAKTTAPPQHATTAPPQQTAKSPAPGEPIHALVPLTKELNAQLTALQNRLSEMAGDAGLQAAFMEKNIEKLARAAGKWQATIDHALRVRLFLPGRYGTEPNASPPLGFASMKLLDTLQKGQEVPIAEMHLPGTEQAHIVMARPVLGADDSVVGLIHLSLAPELLYDILSRVDMPGYVALEQQVNDRPVLLGATGNQTTKKGKVISSIDIPSSEWRVRYWHYKLAPFGTEKITFGLLASPNRAALLVLLALCVAWFIFHKRRYGHVGHEKEYAPQREMRRETRAPTASQPAKQEATTQAPESGPQYGGASKHIIEGKLSWAGGLVPNLPDAGTGTTRSGEDAPATNTTRPPGGQKSGDKGAA